ncbi:MAG TPA: AbrB/MazE/SpoVT family DNA-binding domain-containing protein [Candidatus Nanoarchaeia archaeon]|nr:AbrB/MazE/SpoVT family DNA-binding domain-containing protein [Candidatus Nanoarchaeia archaeon]
MEPKFIGKAKLTTQGQITLPKEARKDLKIAQNSELYWYEIDNSLVLVKNLVSQSELTNTIFKKKVK